MRASVWAVLVLALGVLSSLGVLSTVNVAKAQSTGPIPDQDIWQTAPGQVVDVRFEGNNNLSDNELATVVSTKVTSWFGRMLYGFPLLSKLGSPYQTVDASALSSDTARLNLYYRDHGFLLARAHFHVSPSVDDKKAYLDYLKRRRLYKGPANPTQSDAPVLHDTITFSVEEGPPFTINRIAFEGLENLPEEFQPEITEKVTIKSGERWSRALAAREVERLDSIMVENGYPFFRFDTIVVENHVHRTTVNVLLYFTPGGRYRYGPIHIVYDSTAEEKKTVAEKVVRAQLVTPQGDWYRLFDIQRSEANLYKLNAFDIARVTLDTSYINKLTQSQRDSAQIPVEVFLRPRLRAEFTPGLYAGTGTQGFVAGLSLGYSNRNFTGGADNINLQANWQFVPSTQKRYSGSADYTIPYIGLGRVPLILGVAHTHLHQDSLTTTSHIPAYTQNTYTAHVGSNFILSKLDNRTSITPDISFEYVASSAEDSATRTFLVPQQFGLIPSLTYQDDRTNDIFNPTNGDFLGLTLETGVPLGWLTNINSAEYFKAVPQVKYFYDLSDSGTAVLAGKLRLGKTWLFSGDSGNSIPSADRRFYGGGSTSLRGWPERTLLISNNPDPHLDPSYGGFNVLEASLEYRYAPFKLTDQFSSTQKLLAPLRVVAFYDIGNVWDNLGGAQFPNFSNLAQTIGVGLRYLTIFGALRADLGFKLYDPSGEFTKDNYRPIRTDQKGAWLFSRSPFKFDTKIYSFHFAIGQAF